MHPLLDLDARLVIAHRGASGHAPENTLAAFERAAALGADAFELDVHVSADGKPMVLHDPTLDRTTDRGGAVATLTAAEISQADAGARFQSPDGSNWAGRGLRVPRLEEVLETFPDTPLLIEIKAVAAQGPVRDMLLHHGAPRRVVVASFLWEALEAFREPPFLVGASRRDILRLFLRTRLGLPPGRPACRCYAVPDRWRGWEIPTERFIQRARRQGCPVHVWTVNDHDLARTQWDRGVAGIITNYPDRMRNAQGGVGRSGRSP